SRCFMRVIAQLALMSGAVLGCAASRTAAPASADVESREAQLAVASRYTRLGDAYVQRCDLDAARKVIGRAIEIYEHASPSDDIGYAEALGARSHLREQLHDEAGAALDLSHSIELLSQHQKDVRPALLGAYAELVSVYERIGRPQEAKKAV